MLPTIGLEIHTQLATKTKLFCSNKNEPTQDEPNTAICALCMGHPGTLPVLNGQAVRFIVQAGLALGCKINQFSKFDRKNYFYPDLPKGYQISQYDIPFCVKGLFTLISGKEIRIRRIHLEEDTGRLVHQGSDSLVDFNRAGVPLIELVTEPDFTSSQEVLEFAKELQLLWRYLKISQADMEKGQFRVEANISYDMGTKVELKNLNSFKAVKGGIAYELERQKEALVKGETLVQETRGWDPVKHKTFSQRIKETEKDYRYFPEPDLPPVVISDDELQEIKRSIPELPSERKARFIKEYHLPEVDAQALVTQKELGEYFEKVASELALWEKDIERKEVTKEHMPRLLKLAANYLITEIPRINVILNTKYKILNTITPENFAELIAFTHKGGISSSAAQEVLLEMAKTGNDPHNIIEERGLAQVSDSASLEVIIAQVIQENPKAAQDHKNGKAGAAQFLVGKVMARSKGKANPQAVREILEKVLTP